MHCTKCGCDNRAGRRFCAECGTPLATKCPRCGASNEPAEKFCGDCGSPWQAAPGALQRKHDGSQIAVVSSSPAETPQGERKTVTALFAGIKGSMELIEDLD